MTADLDLARVLPEDANTAALVGRLHDPGVSGPALVAVRGDELVDITSVGHPTMSHLLDALERGEDIGHYGRLTFAMVAHRFMDRDELVKWLMKDRDTDEHKARALAQQVEERGYNPPRRERILENAGAAAVALSANDIADLNALVDRIGVAGNRYDDSGMAMVGL